MKREQTAPADTCMHNFVLVPQPGNGRMFRQYYDLPAKEQVHSERWAVHELCDTAMPPILSWVEGPPDRQPSASPVSSGRLLRRVPQHQSGSTESAGHSNLGALFTLLLIVFVCQEPGHTQCAPWLRLYINRLVRKTTPALS